MDSKDKKQLAKQRRDAAKQAQKYHKEQEKQNKKSSAKAVKSSSSKSKIKEAVNERRAKRRSERRNMTREEKYRREGEEKLRNLQPHDFEGGYYIDEFSEKQRQEKRAQEIRKQENEVIHRNKKPLTSKQIRKRRILISAGIFAAVIIIGAILSLTVLFKTEKIDIEGDVYYDDEQIIAFSNVALQQNIFLGAWNSTPEEIVKNLPYVERAEIGFAIPDTITIKIKDAVPTYVVKDGNGYLVVSSKGRILDTAAENFDNLILLNCGEIKNKSKGQYIDFGDDSVPEILDSVAKSFAANGVDKITGFDISDLSSIIINYDGRIDINIGLPEDIDYKIKTAFTIINEKLDPNNTGNVCGTLDVSTCNKNKISHYKPSPTTATTQPSTTSPATEATEGYDENAYQENYGENGEYIGGEYGNGEYDNGNNYGDNNYVNGDNNTDWQDNNQQYDDQLNDNQQYDNQQYDNGVDNQAQAEQNNANDQWQADAGVNWQPAQ